ncbi:MAG: DUF4185 domain-containing protein [Victivallales bacterium]|nr:DUF4185 domain-containing protein [Victivallales bacterium]
MKNLILAIIVGVGVFVGSCGSGCHGVPAWRDSGIPAAVRVKKVRDLGTLQFEPAIRSRDGGYSGGWQGQSIWWFGDTVTSQPGPDGFCWRSNTASRLCDPTHAVAGKWRFREYKDQTGLPEEMLPFTPAEAAYNREHFNAKVPEKQRYRWALWPGPLVASPDDDYALIFFSRIKGGPNGAWDFYGDGNSVLVWRDMEKKPERGPMLFPAGDFPLGNGALRDGKFLYAYGCESQYFVWPVKVGRVPFDRATERSAWEFYAGNGRWSKVAGEAVPVMEAAPMLSVYRQPHLGCYVAIYSVPLANKIAIRTAPRPEGPWSSPLMVADCLAPQTPDNAGSYAGLAHPELSREGGRIEYVTYYRDTGWLQGEIRLLEIEFE